MVDFTQKAQYTVEDLRRIVALLRAPGGCPWDRRPDPREHPPELALRKPMRWPRPSMSKAPPT